MVDPSDAAKIAEANRFYENGEYDKAFSQYRRLAEEGHRNAPHRLAWMFLKGLGTSASDEDAIKWYKVAAEAGNPIATFDLANSYGARDENALAVEWYQRAAAQGYSPALYRLGLYYRIGKGVVRDDKKATEMFREAAKGGHLFAQRELNKLLLFGSEGFGEESRGHYGISYCLQSEQWLH